MPSNVEIKAKVHDVQQLIQNAKQLSKSGGHIITQQDTFFKILTGHLKLRNFLNGSGQLLFYERPDVDGPKLSNYSILPTTDPDGLTKVLADALGIMGAVKKERLLYMVGQTRVHVDTVEGLGHFMEPERDAHMLDDRYLEHKSQFASQTSSPPRRSRQARPTKLFATASKDNGDKCNSISGVNKNKAKLNVVLNDGQSLEDGESIALKLIEELGVKKENLIIGAYVDLLLAEKK